VVDQNSRNEGVSLDMDERTAFSSRSASIRCWCCATTGCWRPGATSPEAFSLTYHFERSAEAQLKIQAAVAAGGKMVIPSHETCEKQAAQFAMSGNVPRLGGQREWPALLRLCDRLDPSFRA
jgi:hypothetical protein